MRTVNWSLGGHNGHAGSANAEMRSSVERSTNGKGICAKCLHISYKLIRMETVSAQIEV